MKYFIKTYGCQMNRADAAKIASRLKKNGHRPADDSASAELIILNACSVRQSAVNRVLAQIEKFAGKKIILAGCWTPADKKKLKNRGLIFWHPDEYFDQTSSPTKCPSAFVPIMTGCNNFCSYCVVPYTRGRERSRPANKIIREINNLVKKGVKEIILIGQNVNGYRSPAGSKAAVSLNFAQLLKKINDQPGDFWLSFITSHPKVMSEGLIETIARCLKVNPTLHLPMQSGDDEILRAMKRGYTAKHYEGLIKKIRRAFKKYRPVWPPLSLSTDVIVGFPNETKRQFLNTARLMRKIKFDMAYIAQYSPRPGTAAARLTDNVAPLEKKRREIFLNKILAQTALTNNKKYLGRQIEVLINETKNGLALGKTVTNKNIKVFGDHLRVGNRLTAKIVGVTPWSLKGRVSSSREMRMRASFTDPHFPKNNALEGIKNDCCNKKCHLQNG